MTADERNGEGLFQVDAGSVSRNTLMVESVPALELGPSLSNIFSALFDACIRDTLAPVFPCLTETAEI